MRGSSLIVKTNSHECKSCQKKLFILFATDCDFKCLNVSKLKLFLDVADNTSVRYLNFICLIVLMKYRI